MFRKSEFAIISEITFWNYTLRLLCFLQNRYTRGIAYTWFLRRTCAMFRMRGESYGTFDDPREKIARSTLQKFITFATIKGIAVFHNCGEQLDAIITGTQHRAALLRAVVAPTSPPVLAPKGNYSDRLFASSFLSSWRFRGLSPRDRQWSKRFSRC